jgi:hypothetical protein
MGLRAFGKKKRENFTRSLFKNVDETCMNALEHAAIAIALIDSIRQAESYLSHFLGVIKLNASRGREVNSYRRKLIAAPPKMDNEKFDPRCQCRVSRCSMSSCQLAQVAWVASFSQKPVCRLHPPS